MLGSAIKRFWPRNTGNGTKASLSGRFSLMDVRLTTFLLLGFAFLGAVSLRAVETKSIVFFGDSLTAGYGLVNPAAEAYPALIQKRLDAEHLAYRVVNAGLSGETTSAGVRRVDWILRQPVDIFVLAIGANDGLRGID